MNESAHDPVAGAATVQPLTDCNDSLEYIALGQRHTKNGRFTVATSCFEAALALDPNLPMAHNNLGWIAQRQGNLTGALFCYRRALELNGSFRLAQINLACLLSQMTLNADAQPIWRALINSYPEDRALLDKAISTNLRAGDLLNASWLAEQYALLTHGSRWVKSESAPIPDVPFPVPLLSVPKLEHDLEQFGYLQSLGALADDFTHVMQGYKRVRERIKPLGGSAPVGLEHEDRLLIGHIYN